MSFVKEVLPDKREKLSPENKKKFEEKLKSEKKENDKLVKGVFKNLESPGGDLIFAYREYKNDPVRVYHFQDGNSYTIPLGVARHINRQCKYKRHAYLLDADGKPMQGIGKPVERYQFISNEFL